MCEDRMKTLKTCKNSENLPPVNFLCFVIIPANKQQKDDMGSRTQPSPTTRKWTLRVITERGGGKGSSEESLQDQSPSMVLRLGSTDPWRTWRPLQAVWKIKTLIIILRHDMPFSWLWHLYWLCISNEWLKLMMLQLKSLWWYQWVLAGSEFSVLHSGKK